MIENQMLKCILIKKISRQRVFKTQKISADAGYNLRIKKNSQRSALSKKKNDDVEK